MTINYRNYFKLALLFSVLLSSLLFGQVNVLTNKVIEGNIRQLLQFTGETSPSIEAYATADVNGPVAEVLVEVGERVTKGQTLCKIDETRFELALRQAEAMLERAQQQFKEDEKDYKRNETLFNSKAITQKTLDTALTKLISSKTNLKQAQVSYDTAKLDLARCKVTSPINGYFVDRNIEIGQSMTRGQVMGRIIDLDSIYVDARISEADIRNIKIGQACLIESKYEGIVEYINLHADNSRAFKVRIKLANPNLFFRANVFVKGSITVEDYKNVPVFPSKAIRNERSIYYIYKIVNGKAHRQNITLKAQQGDLTLAEEVNVNDEVVTVGQDNLSEGAEVAIRNQ
ncbi:MAG: efflux RND transporter periplasmic adaptor subunit [Candidatus Riflebacteria bacterium]|nr:efflux RND transporter periplasmic adaptor subunit [Candidatus Riflebacteria bacterium]